MSVDFVKPGDIAVCRQNKLGIVTEVKDGKAFGKQIGGFFVYDGQVHGHDWESVDPRVVGFVNLEELGERCNA